jgi:hypothetical protein
MAESHGPSGADITFDKIAGYAGGVTVTSNAVDLYGQLDAAYAKSGNNASPPLTWSGPPETVTWALIVEDPDAPMDQPVVHWMAWNIPGHVNSLPAGVSKTERPAELQGGVQGLNTHRKSGWMGMAPPPGDRPHHYHFQVFALDRELELESRTPLAELVNVLKAATLGKGELVGTFSTPDRRDSPPPARTGHYGSQPGR